MNVAEPRIYEFDDFRLDAGRRLLLQRGEPVPLKPRVFDTLLYLARHQGRVLEKDELMRAIWPDATVEENNLNQNVSTLRRALGESRGENRYIVTVPGRGYRFAARVSTVTDEASRVAGDSTTVAGVADRPSAVSGEDYALKWTQAPALGSQGAAPAEAPAGVPLQPTTPGRLPWILAGVLAAALVVSVWAAWRQPPGDTGQRVLSLDLDAGNEVSQPAISSDGTRLVFLASGRLAIRKLDQAQAKIAPLAGTEGASSPFFSPDGQWVGYFAHHQLRKVAVEGGESVTLCDAPVDRGGTWTEDGQIVAGLSASGELSSVPASGGTPRAFSSLQGESPEVTNHRRPEALPGGKGVLFISGTGVATGRLRVLPPGGGRAKTLVESSSTARYLVSGYLLFNQGATMFAAPFDLNRLELTGSASPVIQGVAYDHFRGADFDVSASGTLVYRSGPPAANRAVTWLDSSGARGRVLAKVGAYTSPRLSPDGKRLALMSESEVWIYDLAREKMTQLTFGSLGGCCPVWSPDGDYVAFASQSSLTWARWDGSGTEDRLQAAPGTSAVPWSFSPDGKWLAFHRNEARTGWDLWAAPVDRAGGRLRLGPPQPLLRQPGTQAAPAISPDGRWLAYGSDEETGRAEIYVIPFSPQGARREGKWPVSTSGSRTPRWSANGKEIFFRAPDGRLMAAAVTAKGNSFRSDKPRVWSAMPLADVGILPNFDVAPDGKRIVALFDAEETKPDDTHLRILLNINDELRRLRANRRKVE